MSNSSRIIPTVTVPDTCSRERLGLNRRDALKLSLGLLALGVGVRPENSNANPTVMVWATVAIAVSAVGSFFLQVWDRFEDEEDDSTTLKAEDGTIIIDCIGPHSCGHCIRSWPYGRSGAYQYWQNAAEHLHSECPVNGIPSWPPENLE